MILKNACDNSAKCDERNLNEYATSALARIGGQLSLKGKESEAWFFYHAAHYIMRSPSKLSEINISKQLELGSQLLELEKEDISLSNPPDTYRYHEDECDVGPRPFRTPIVPEVVNCDIDNTLEICIIYNKALLHQSSFDYHAAAPLYESTLRLIQNVSNNSNKQRNKLLELGVRAHNNLGHIRYIEGREDQACSNFELSLTYAKQLLECSNDSKLDYATVLSNWCRVHWMQEGDVGDDLYEALHEVLCCRVSVLDWDHIDVASAHYNLGVAEYAKLQYEKASSHFMQYLHISSHWKKRSASEKVLDPIPALLYILLMKNEEKDDSVSKELMRSLRTLRNKRHNLGPHNVEIVSVLNSVGTLLFRQQDCENALLFFREELRLEENLENLSGCKDTSVIITCNNIGRILQEIGRLPEAIEYYHRALQNEYGDDIKQWKLCSNGASGIPQNMPCDKDFPLSTMDLYSIIWYNLGLTYDRLGSRLEAIDAFQISLGISKAMLGIDHAYVACLLYHIGVLQMEQRLLKEATLSFQEALRIRRVVATGQLNDQHIVRTLQKLASLHEIKGDFDGSLEALHEILCIQRNPSNLESLTEQEQAIGITLREIAELHHTRGEVEASIRIAQESAEFLKPRVELESLSQSACTELVSTLLLLGSLYHEVGNPIAACTTFSLTSILMDQTRSNHVDASPFDALREVCSMLTLSHCAPVA